MKFIQIYYQVWYRLRQYFNFFNIANTKSKFSIVGTNFFAYPFIASSHKYKHPNSFEFLNLSKTFEKEVNWNENEFGKLWNYNLQYFDYINQNDIDIEKANALLHSFWVEIKASSVKNEPYPVSLRILNLIKFIHRTNYSNTVIASLLNNQIQFLKTHKEFHILGNHLLENAFALVAAALVTQNTKLYKEASALLVKELNEQILADGAHFERSVMYHSILLERLLDLINMHQKIELSNSNELAVYAEKKAALMLGFLSQICFANSDMPMFNDASNGIAASASELLKYASQLGIVPVFVQLKDSGYRKFISKSLEVIVDVEGIAPSYQPGHAHADTSSFICYVNKLPFLVETGTSTYQIGDIRNSERGSSAHNVVVVNNTNSAQVWGGFRVAQRPQVKLFKDSATEIELSHDAYLTIGVSQYLRRIQFAENEIAISDTLHTQKQLHSCIAYFHFHPDIEPKVHATELKIETTLASITFNAANKIELMPYQFALGFNKTKTAFKAAVHFDTHLHTLITRKYE